MRKGGSLNFKNVCYGDLKYFDKTTQQNIDNFRSNFMLLNRTYVKNDRGGLMKYSTWILGAS